MPDLVREALFNLLRGHSEGALVLDLFSGSGAIALEAISRGASRCVMVERDRRAIEVIEKNIDALGVRDRCEVVRADALSPTLIARLPRPAHLIAFDPPYPMVWDARMWERCRAQLARLVDLLDETGYLIVRTPNPPVRRIKAGDADETGTTRYEPVDLSIPGAKGPESHAYGRMAVHLYAADR